MVKEELKDLEKKMKGSVEHFRKALSKLRTGRASISVFEDVKIDYYGTLSPINQVATLAVPEPTLITIQPWETSVLEAIEKAIRAADLGLNPINDGITVTWQLSSLDTDRRKEIAKYIHKLMEEEKTVVRNMRRESKEMIELLENEKEITEDDKFWGYDKLQEITDQNVEKIEKLASEKEKEILEI